MKKTLVALAALAAASAFAADSVTLYGVADAWLGQAKAGAASTQTVVNSGGLSTSRIGVKTKEDLGDGLGAFATLEYNTPIDTGAAWTPRTTIVGLSGGFGSASLGYQATAYDEIAKGVMDASGDSGAFSAVRYGWGHKAAPSVTYGTTAVGFAHTERFSNGVRYDTPNMDGFQASLQWTSRPPTGAATSPFHDMALSAKYSNGPLTLAVATQQDEPALLGTTVAKRKNTVFGGNYDFGPAKLFAAYNHASLPALASGATPTMNSSNVGVSVPLDAWTLVAQVSHMKPKNTSNDNAMNIVDLEGRYALSKRTTLYAGYMQRKQTAVGAVNNTMRNVGLGIRHSF